MIVLDERRGDAPTATLTGWNDGIETFFLDRPYRSLGGDVRVWRPLGDQHHAMPTYRSRRWTSWFHFGSRSQIKTCRRLMTPASVIFGVVTICGRTAPPDAAWIRESARGGTRDHPRTTRVLLPDTPLVVPKTGGGGTSPRDQGLSHCSAKFQHASRRSSSLPSFEP